MVNDRFAANPEAAAAFQDAFETLEPDLFPAEWADDVYVALIEGGFSEDTLDKIPEHTINLLLGEFARQASQHVQDMVIEHADRIAAGTVL